MSISPESIIAANNLTIEQWLDYMESLDTIDEYYRFDSIIIRLSLDEYARLNGLLEPKEMLSKVSIETQYIFTLILKQAGEI